MADTGAIVSNATRDAELMPPPPPRPQKSSQLVLDEDQYTSKLEAIIERDFFPDIPKVKSTLEWLQAVKSGDPELIRQAQINIAHRRAGLKTPLTGSGAGATAFSATPLVGDTPLARPGTGVWATPANHRLSTPAMTPVVGGPDATPMLGASAAAGAAAALSAATGAEQRAPNIGLDAFLATYTSEDNASFGRIINEEQKKKRAKVSHYLEDKNRPLMLEGPGPLDEYGGSGQQPMTLQFTKHVPANALYYHKDQVRLSDKEVAEQALGPPKQVMSRNTRFKSTDTEVTALEAAASAAAGGAGAGGGTPAAGRLGTTQVGGTGRDWDRLSTPSFTPGREGFSPLMTWGEIGSTPLRLDSPDDMLLPSSSGAGLGPDFQVQDLGNREKVLHKLAHSKSGGLRKPSPALTLLQQQQRRNSTPMLSPAARALATKLKGGSTPIAIDHDRALRASYAKGTGKAQAGGERSTPLTGSRPASRAGTPLISAGGRPAAGPSGTSTEGQAVGTGASKPFSITDDLLKLK
mmetsp:Transcript_18021/g.38736  ORF Transcript_18021/g.38736 Transcript_18021/m.38736 type:complete len:521 (-) Transcript_18021:634-2196(-)